MVALLVEWAIDMYLILLQMLTSPGDTGGCTCHTEQLRALEYKRRHGETLSGDV